jgi:hypothetical protein
MPWPLVSRRHRWRCLRGAHRPVLRRDEPILLLQDLPRLAQRQDRDEGFDGTAPQLSHCLVRHAVENTSRDLSANPIIVGELAPDLGDDRLRGSRHLGEGVRSLQRRTPACITPGGCPFMSSAPTVYARWRAVGGSESRFSNHLIVGAMRNAHATKDAAGSPQRRPSLLGDSDTFAGCEPGAVSLALADQQQLAALVLATELWFRTGMGLHICQPGALPEEVRAVDDSGRLPRSRLIRGIDQLVAI